MSAKPSPETYQLKITLADSEPEVWRRVQVSAHIALTELHDIVQKAMGWENQHSYAFRQTIGDAPCSPQQSLADVFEAMAKPSQGIAKPFQQIAQKPIYYTYDFQSGWLHRIEIESLTAEDAICANALPRCLAGESACPPENSGGVWGYEDFLTRLEDSNAPDYTDLIEKYGDFDPYRFDLSAANRRLETSTSASGSLG